MPLLLHLDHRVFSLSKVESRGETNPWWLWPNLLSLDAPLVAVSWQALFARHLHLPVNAAVSLVLLLTVWLLYALDRCFDSLRPAGPAESPRHRFYRLHRGEVRPFALAAVCTIVLLAVTALPPPILASGAAIAMAVLLYFGIVHLTSWRWCKELAVAALFALGVCLPAASLAPAFPPALILPAVLFTLLCWLNCAAIDRWESGPENPHASTRWIAGHLRSAALLIVGIAVGGYARTASLIFAAVAVSALAFLLIDRAQSRLSTNALRVLADFALLSPLPFLILSR